MEIEPPHGTMRGTRSHCSVVVEDSCACVSVGKVLPMSRNCFHSVFLQTPSYKRTV